VQYIIIAGWCVFLIFSGGYYFKVMIPTMQYYTINNPYTVDSVWNAEENDWHNDMLLNTIFSEKKVYINPESWYINYVQAFAKNVVLDNAMDIYVKEEDFEQYVRENHMIAIQNTTLFEQSVVDYISTNAEEGAAYLYIAEDSCAFSDAIDVLQDKEGNIYLKGHINE